MNTRKTKIICTIGPAAPDAQSIVKLIENGMDAARLNFSHGSYEVHTKNIENIRRAEELTHKNIAIIQDLQGPKIRIGKIKNDKALLDDGKMFSIICNETFTGNDKKACTSYSNLALDVKSGNTLLLDDGYIILNVEKIKKNEIITRIVQGGQLKSNKGIIAPGVPITAPALSEKDIEDVAFGLKSGVDFVALSFVRSERDVILLKNLMKKYGKIVPIISKIERFEGYEDLDDIINESDAVMVARGDLGLEMPTEQVPILQKEIIKKCNYYGKPVITATQMLESMIINPRPTRAEASDVANAVLDGTDCVMLSGETSVGKYPYDAVIYMDKIIRSTEEKFSSASIDKFKTTTGNLHIVDALSKASCVIAEQLEAAAIIPITKSGMTAQIISKYKPKTPIIAVTDSIATLRKLSLHWGVYSINIKDEQSEFSVQIDSAEAILMRARSILLQNNHIKEGDYAVCVRGLNRSETDRENLIKVIKI